MGESIAQIDAQIIISFIYIPVKNAEVTELQCAIRDKMENITTSQPRKHKSESQKGFFPLMYLDQKLLISISSVGYLKFMVRSTTWL